MNKENRERNIMEVEGEKHRKGETISSKRQLAQLRKHNVKQLQDIELQNNAKI